MEYPLISVIIPLYNAEKTISQTINSVLDQTYPNIEVIVIDDFSSDNSFQIVSQLNSPKIHLFKNKKKGACAARNYGFECSSGDFIQYLDADDIISPSKIELQLELIINKKEEIASCGWVKFINEYKHLKTKSQKINKSYDKPYEWLIDAWKGNEMGLISIWLTPRVVIEQAGEWNEDLLVNQDGEFFCRVLLNVKRINYCNNSIAYYRMGNPNSISKSKKSIQKAQSHLASFNLYEKHVNHLLKDYRLRKALGYLYLKFIYHYYNISNDIIDQAWSNFYNLNVGKPWNIGGNTLGLLTKFVGFKKALKIKKYLS